jgi:hypothetical protein
MTTSGREAGIRVVKRFCNLFGLMDEVGIWVADDPGASSFIQGQLSSFVSEDMTLAASGRAWPCASSCMLHSIDACRFFAVAKPLASAAYRHVCSQF